MEIGERIVLKVSDPKWGIKKRPAPAIFLGEEGEGPGRKVKFQIIETGEVIVVGDIVEINPGAN